MTWRFMIVVILVVLCVATEAKKKRPTTHRVFRYNWAKPCEEPSNALSCDTIQLRMGKNGEVGLDGDCYVSRPAETFKRLDINVTRCRDRVSSNTCEHYTTWSIRTGICALIVAPNMPWSRFVDAVEPPVKCPLKPGNYTGRNASLNVDAMSMLLSPTDFDTSIWIGQFALFDTEKDLHICGLAEFQLLRSRTE